MIPAFLWALPTALITQYSVEYNLDKTIVAAIVTTESSGNSSATRYEPFYKYLYFVDVLAKNNGITKQTEEIHQKTSFGLMQVMGATARELGHKTQLPELINPDVGLKYGCKYLKKQYLRYGNYDDAVAAYNAGSAVKSNGMYINKSYIDKVMRKARELGFRR